MINRKILIKKITLSVIIFILASVFSPSNGYSIGSIIKEKSDTITINIKNFGVKGDAISDDAALINTIINKYGGKPLKVIFPTATYKINTPLNLSQENVNLIFDKNSTLLIGQNGGIIITADHCSVQNATLIGPGIPSDKMKSGFGILLSGVSYVRIANNTFKSIGGNNIFLVNNHSKGCNNNLIVNNIILQPTSNYKLVQDVSGIIIGYSGIGYSHQNNLITGNIIDGNGHLSHGIALITHGINNQITNNKIKNCLRYGIVSYESDYVPFTLTKTTITGNLVENIGPPDGTTSPYGMGIYLMKSHYSTISNNKLNNCLINTDNSETLPSGAISINGSTYCTIENNIITNSHRYGITSSLSFYSKILNNEISGVREAGIYLMNTSNNIITGNHITDAKTYGIKGYFSNTIRPYAKTFDIAKYKNIDTGQDLEISNNTISNNQNDAIYLTGDNADPTANYKGNILKNITIKANVLKGKQSLNPIKILKGSSNTENISSNKIAP